MGKLDIFAGGRVGIGAESMVLAGNLHMASGQMQHRVVGAVVAEFQFAGLGAQRLGEDLMAKADAEHRHPAEQLPHRAGGVVERLRIAGHVA